MQLRHCNALTGACREPVWTPTPETRGFADLVENAEVSVDEDEKGKASLIVLSVPDVADDYKLQSALNDDLSRLSDITLTSSSSKNILRTVQQLRASSCG
jgi:hypothetical protein